MQENNQPLIGKRREGRKLTDISAGDPWTESPMYAPSIEEFESEHVNHWPVGETLCGIFQGLRRTKADSKADQRDYAVFETDDGEKFRAYSPGQLRYQLEQLNKGTFVEITYLGKEYVENLGRDIHQFKTLVDEGASN